MAMKKKRNQNLPNENFANSRRQYSILKFYIQIYSFDSSVKQNSITLLVNVGANHTP